MSQLSTKQRMHRAAIGLSCFLLVWLVADFVATGQDKTKKGSPRKIITKKKGDKSFIEPGKKKSLKGRADSPPLRVGNMEAQLSDGSKLNVSLSGQNLKLHTAYGELNIPIVQIRAIRFATRTRPEIQQQIKRAISQLGSDNFRTRQDATIRIRAWGTIAYPILKQSNDSKDLEQRKRIAALISEIKGSNKKADLEFRSQDEVQTDNSTLSGQIKLDHIVVDTFPFGRQRILLTDIRMLKHRNLSKSVLPLLPDPGRLSRFRNQIGKSFRFHVTGTNRNSIWGTKYYTLDSPLSAAVHAGVVKVGEKGVVTVKIHPTQKSFKGTTRNGVRSYPYGAYPGSYEIVKE